jgi:5-methylcytosine-specific restriction endonuclease McrA
MLQQLEKTSMNYLRKGIYSIEEVLSKQVDPTLHDGTDRKTRFIFDGDSMKATSHRYWTFKYKGVVCADCGIVGRYFAKEKDAKSIQEIYHFNLYALDDNGQEVLMTKDHITAKSKGGANHLDNYQPMCTICNCKKGND